MRFDDWLVKPELEEKKRELRRKMKKKEMEDYESFKRFSKVWNLFLDALCIPYCWIRLFYLIQNLRNAKESLVLQSLFSCVVCLYFAMQLFRRGYFIILDILSLFGQNREAWEEKEREEREKIKEFWLSLTDEQVFKYSLYPTDLKRRELVKLEKEAVLKKMKEQQKHTCSCSVCGRRR